MLQAKCKCRKLHTRPYGWTLELTRMMTKLCYWQAALCQAEGRPYNARFLWHLACALELLTMKPDKMGDTICKNRDWETLTDKKNGSRALQWHKQRKQAGRPSTYDTSCALKSSDSMPDKYIESTKQPMPPVACLWLVLQTQTAQSPITRKRTPWNQHAWKKHVPDSPKQMTHLFS